MCLFDIYVFVLFVFVVEEVQQEEREREKKREENKKRIKTEWKKSQILIFWLLQRADTKREREERSEEEKRKAKTERNISKKTSLKRDKRKITNRYYSITHCQTCFDPIWYFCSQTLSTLLLPHE